MISRQRIKHIFAGCEQYTKDYNLTMKVFLRMRECICRAVLYFFFCFAISILIGIIALNI